MLANAKINLFLHVTGKLHSGYHNLESLIIPIGICDNIYITVAAKKGYNFNIKGAFAHLVSETDNLVLKTIDAICEDAGVNPPGLDILLEKNIPVGAGLGGGSSDAATTLKIMNALLGLNYNNEHLAKIGSKLGADIPFFIENRPALISGIGHIETLVDMPPLNLLLIYPNMALSTKDVFNHQPLKFSHDIPIINTHDDKDDFISFLHVCDNELQNSAISLMPQINDVIDVLSAQSDCLLARMTGSGSTCFGIFENEFSCRMAESALSRKHPNWWIRAV